ncbi:uncharacterized protein BCR38DRAFT_433394 [Pseudomassariella vexata]|uniref:Uncharacterized protein n=1 Tax=Pseudomassariella vexata TaxID=1141098 RepID=A0A1Y2DX80_9PEZI|nr:uncharacterized protein BCR38DRAFT_433394 [Pseudomassariella vexata]ORY63898.1 hypothetical protein BCR38DRAFT_433394 [Pseudomassariella vexata]
MRWPQPVPRQARGLQRSARRHHSGVPPHHLHNHHSASRPIFPCYLRHNYDWRDAVQH